MNKRNNLYRIGAVSRLTGITQDALRIWERRYQVVTPHRTEKGGRLYSEEDIARLTAIKSLVDEGHAISTVANLTLEELNKRLNRNQPAEPSRNQNEISLCLVGQAIQVKAKAHQHWPDNISLSGVFHDLQDFLNTDEHCHTVIIELQYIDKRVMRSLVEASLNTLAENVVLLYAFAPTSIVTQLQRKGFQLMREPLPFDQVLQLSTAQQAPSPALQLSWDINDISRQPAPKRHFSGRQLAYLCSVKSRLDCECPNHMSSLIEQLSAFERYTEQCEINSPQDAELHTMLHKATARARWLMESALDRLIKTDGIELPPD